MIILIVTSGIVLVGRITEEKKNKLSFESWVQTVHCHLFLFVMCMKNNQWQYNE
jgi:hypothetical protein